VSLLDKQPASRSKKRSPVCITRHALRQVYQGLYADDERRPSLGSEQQLNPEARHTQEQLSSHNLTRSHKKESTQLSKAQACWRKHRYTNWLLFLTSIITVWMAITHFVPSLSFLTFMTGTFGLVASEFHIWKPWQQAQSTQQQAQMMTSSFLASCSLCVMTFAELC